MVDLDNGGQAFPLQKASGTTSAGMSLRDYFAGQIIAGMMANHRRLLNIVTPNDCQLLANTKIAREAYATADAMLAARKEFK